MERWACMRLWLNVSILTAFVLLLIFVVLRLTENIVWSWGWVLAPLWIPLGLTTILCVVLSILGWWADRETLRRLYKEWS